MKGILIVLCLCFYSEAFAEKFVKLLEKIETHDLVQSQLNKVKSIQENAKKLGSWGDPKLSVAAINFPQDSLAQDESMMTGFQFGLAQKISLSGKYGKLEDAQLEVAKSQKAMTSQLKREFTKTLWILSIAKERLVKEEVILKENLAWIKSNLKITKRLYSTGKVPQQAVLDIQIRKSDLRAQLEQNHYSQKSLRHQLSVLLSVREVTDVDLNSIPWKYLDKWELAKEDYDYRKVALQHGLSASELKVSAQNRDFVPDITLGISYTKRNDIDGLGDFVGASIAIPLPTSDTKYAAKKSAVFKKMESEKNYRNYLNTKENTLKMMAYDIKDVANQLSILQRETLKFAKSSRDVTAKSYSRGGADYLELLRSELQYQKQLIKEVNLIANLKNKKINYLFVKGDRLYPGELK